MILVDLLEKNQKDKVGLKTPKSCVIALAEPTEVSSAKLMGNILDICRL